MPSSFAPKEQSTSTKCNLRPNRSPAVYTKLLLVTHPSRFLYLGTFEVATVAVDVDRDVLLQLPHVELASARRVAVGDELHGQTDLAVGQIGAEAPSGLLAKLLDEPVQSIVHRVV